jgi:hypothetical protein
MMSKSVWWFAAVLAIGAQSASATCSCQCVEGVARTACTSVEEARANPNECGVGMQKVACDSAPPTTGSPLRYEAPAGATDCRSARLWDPHSDSYTVVAKVCDLDPDAAAAR